MRERFERLLEASKRFTRTLSARRRQLLTSRQNLLIHHAIDCILTDAASLEDAAAGILKTLGENLGWQVTVLWVAGEETLRCIEIWHRPNAPRRFRGGVPAESLCTGRRVAWYRLGREQARMGRGTATGGEVR